jgi:hypothetical protein
MGGEKMLVKITMSSGKEEWGTLKATDAKSRQEYTQDLLSDDQCVNITEVDGKGTVAVMDKESYEWWEPVIEGLNRVDQLKVDYRKRFEGVDKVIDDATEGIIDLEDNISAQKAALKEAFGEI